ncbi:hypothetical protein [Streptomyces roseus]|uniref:Uncharacterized protein n=1 Tax=Streptomyces roseus TaxID=66430 RepID=A0A0J7AEX4_9ACTN|nr:hypothetical protein [Streptomyces roseus]KMO95756.1 hypothetical protein ACS04_21245 [Streptomyces roseus]
MSSTLPPEPPDRPGRSGPDDTDGPEDASGPDGREDARGRSASSRGRLARWRSGSYRWQTLLAALVAAAAGIVVALVSRNPPPPPVPTPTRLSEPVVVTRTTRQDADPAYPPAGVAVTFDGTVQGLGPDSGVFAMVQRGDEKSNWPVAFAVVDRRSGTWQAVVHVPKPRLPLKYWAGVMPFSPRPNATPGTSPWPVAPPATEPAAPALDRLRREGPEAEGITGLTPLRPVAPPGSE